MEIIKRGKPPAERNWQGECSHCHSVVRAKEHELHVTQAQRDGAFGTAPCPVCKLDMFFYPQD